MTESYFLVRCVERFKFFFKNENLDFDQLKAILTLKLMLDDRKVSLQESIGGKSKMGSMKQNLMMMAFVGFFMGMMMVLPLDLYYKMTVIAGMNMFFMVMYMISDFSSVLLDVRDSTLIMTKPVHSTTMNTARVLHVAYYMLMMFMALNFFPLGFGVFQYGVFFAFSVVLMMFFLSFLVIFITTILYSFLLERFTGEKLKDIINLFQIVLSVITIVGYQVMIRMFDFVDANMVIRIRWWTYLMPPTWFAGLFKVIVDREMTTPYVVMAILSIIFPIVMGYGLIRWIFPRYERYLMKLEVEDGVFVNKEGLFNRIKESLYHIGAKDYVESAFMRFASANMSRDRKLKLMIYPNHALAFLFPVVMLLPNLNLSEGLASNLETIRSGPYYLSLYLTVLFLVTNFEFMKFSSNHKAAVIYDSFPLVNYNVIYRATMKAYYLKYIMPSLLVLSLLFVVVFGRPSFLGIVMVNLMAPLALAIKGYMFGLFIPFSEEVATAGNKNIFEAFAMAFVLGGMAFLQYFVFKLHFLIPIILMVVVLGATKFCFVGILKRAHFKTS